MMKKRKLEWSPFVLFIGLTVCLMLMWSLRKEGWFLDEVYSYGLSNSTEGPFLTDLHADWDTGCASALILLFSAHSLLAVPRKLYKVDGHWLKFRLSWMYVDCNVCSGIRTAA